MKATQISLARTASLLAGALLVIGSAQGAEADALPTFTNNYIKFSATGASVDGSKAAYQARSQHSKSGAAGIEDFNYTYELSKEDTLEVNGKVMANDGDYLAAFKFTRNEFGTLEAGYKRTRTFYDGRGGFFPTNNTFMPIYRRPLFVDRGKFFVNATLAMPKAPVFTFKYSNDTRSGRKDSTIWGDSDLTGIPIWNVGALNPFSANRKILPAYIQLNERLETWEASMRHTVGNTTAVLSIGGDRIKNNNARSVDRFVGEVRPWPPFPTSPAQLVPNNFNSNPNRGFDVQGFKERAWTAGARLETVLSDKVTAFGGINYRSAKEDISAQRLIGVDVLTGGGVRTGLIGGFYLAEPTGTPRIASASRPPYSYTLAGNLRMEVVTANIGLQAKPMPDLYIEPALKMEQYFDSGNALATYVTTAVKSSTGDVTTSTTPLKQHFGNSEKPWIPALDVRYSGIRNLALYGEWEYRTSKQDERSDYGSYGFVTSASNIAAAVTSSYLRTQENIKEKHQNIMVGANWTPAGAFSGRAELFSKDHENRFQGYGVSSGGYYILDYDIYGAKLTGIVKPMPTVAFTTRYVIQKGKAATATDNYAKQTGNDSRRHQISEKFDWNPSRTVYVQANASIVFEQIVTAYPYVTGGAAEVIRNADNNYWNGDVIVGFAATKEMDVQIQGTYYKANNWEPARAYATLPLGAGATESTISIGAKYKISPKTVASAKLGYMDSKNDTVGGFADFKGPLAYVALEHAF